MIRIWRIGIVLVALALTAGVPTAWAHGDEDMPAGVEAEIEVLAKQPARVLAQQAMAMIEVNGDSAGAAIRLDAALESEDQSDVDRVLLEQATETLDGGDVEGAVPVLDEALSRPLGAASGEALHEAGREFRPGTGAQEVVAIVLGALMLLLGLVALRRSHHG